MGYVYPVGDIYVPADWHNHCCERNPPSSEPGTDYASAYGTPVRCPGNGRVVDVKTSNSNATGRYVTVDLDDGRRARGLHFSRVEVILNQRVTGTTVLGYSGASGYGSDWYYGSHLHQTLWKNHSYQFCSTCTLDFELYVGSPTPPPTPPDEEEDDDMAKNSAVYYKRSSDGATVYLLFNTTSGWWMEYLGTTTVPHNSNNLIAGTLGTDAYANVNESWATALKNAMNRIKVNVDLVDIPNPAS
jgi:murein DD-endopeptidase MepM/ murein hydrolase activator NlpD